MFLPSIPRRTSIPAKHKLYPIRKKTLGEDFIEEGFLQCDSAENFWDVSFSGNINLAIFKIFQFLCSSFMCCCFIFA